MILDGELIIIKVVYAEYNPMDGVTPYGTMNTTGVKGLGEDPESLEFIKIQAIQDRSTTDWDWSIDPVGLRYCCREYHKSL